MATRDDVDIARWVDDRMAALAPPAEWDPNEARGLVRLRERRGGGTGHRRRWIWLAVATGTIVVLLSPTPIVRGFAHACGEFVRRTLSGSEATHTTETLQRALLADVALRDASGRATRLSEYRGKVVLVTYWTTACGQCWSEVSWFNEFQRTYGDQGFVVVAVSVDPGGAAAVNQYLADRPIDYRVVLGDRDIARLHGAASIPTTFILDRTGRIAVRHVGYCSKREFESDIRTVLAEQ